MSGPPLSSIGVKATSAPYDRLEAVGAVRTRRELGIAAERDRRRHVLEVGEAGDAVLVGERLRDVVRVLVRRRRLVEHPEPLGQRGLELGVHVVARGGLGVGHVVLEQVPRVLGEHVDGAVLDLGDVHLALADAEVALDRVAVLLERLRVELGDDLVGVVVLRTDDDRLRRLAVARRSAAERIARRTPCQGYCRPDRDRCECNEPALSCCDHSGFPSLMGRPMATRGRTGPERSSGVLAARTPAGTTRRWVSAKHPSTTSARTITRMDPPSISA